MAGNQHLPPPQSPPKTPQNESGDKLDQALNWNPKFSLPPPTESTPRDTPLDERTSFHITSNDPPAEGSVGADARRNGRGRQSRRKKRSGSKSSSGSGGSQNSIENKKIRTDGVYKKHVRKDYGSYNATQPEPNSRKYRETSPSKIDGIPKPKPEADLASFAENNKGNVWFDHGMAAKIKALSLQSPSRVCKNRKSPTRSATRSPVKSKSRSPTKNIGRSPANNRSRSPTKRIGRSPAKSKSRSSTKSIRRGGKNAEEDSPSLPLEASSETEDISEVASLSESQGHIGRSGNFNSTLLEEEAQIVQSEETFDSPLPDEEALIDQSDEIFNSTLPDEDAQIDRREETLNPTQNPDPAPLSSNNIHTSRSENSSTPHQVQQLFDRVYWRQRQREARRQRKNGTQIFGEITPRIRSDDYHGPTERSYPPSSRPLQNRHSGSTPRTNRPESGPWRGPHRMQESSVYPRTPRSHRNRHPGSAPRTNRPESGPSREPQGMQELSVYPSSVTLNQQESFWIQNRNIGQGQYPVPGISLINQNPFGIQNQNLGQGQDQAPGFQLINKQPFWIQNQEIQHLGHGQNRPPDVPLINQQPFWIQDQSPRHGQHQAPGVPSINQQPFWIQNQEIQDLGHEQHQPHGLPLINQQSVAFGDQAPLNGTSSVMHGHQNLGYGQNQAALAAIGERPNMHNGLGHYPPPAIHYNQYYHAHTAIPVNNAPTQPDRAAEILNETLAGKTPEEQMAAEHKRSEVIAEKMKPADSDVGASKNCHWK